MVSGRYCRPRPNIFRDQRTYKIILIANWFNDITGTQLKKPLFNKEITTSWEDFTCRTVPI
jgi:hypothetical protein